MERVLVALGCDGDSLHDLLVAAETMRAEVGRLTQLHERIAASDDVAKAYQQVYFEDFPTVKQAVTETLLAKEQLAAEQALADQLAVALAAQGSASFDEDTNRNIKRLALDAYKEARRER
jgi:hypothetical protein